MTIEEYLKNRRDTIGVIISCDLTEWVSEIQLPEYVIKHPLILEFKDVIADITALWDAMIKEVETLNWEEEVMISGELIMAGFPSVKLQFRERALRAGHE
ncbi:hypothetical protein TWF718_005187 [Orbilia javanica]|uniref:Uncharacterized protein n=1 Tax=Orbilia javanica TaxID=47235 RepID=A0AAN8MT87_9PEZI